MLRRDAFLQGCIGAASLVLLVTSASAARTPFHYVSPVPGARMVPARHGIALRQGAAFDPASLAAGSVRATGAVSGAHPGRLHLSADGRTLFFDPDIPWTAGERVHVDVAPGLRTRAGEQPGFAFDFDVSVAPSPGHTIDPLATMMGPLGPAAPTRSLARAPRIATEAGPCDAGLAGVPPVGVAPHGTKPGEAWFLAPWSQVDMAQASLEIVDDFGQPIYLRSFPGEWLPTDLKVQPDGRLSYWLNVASQFYWMDSTYAVVDSIRSVMGYYIDVHDMQWLANGHLLFFCGDPEPVGMDTVVAGGDPDAIVLGLVVFELDENRDPVFEWRSWDHFQITDGSVSPASTLTGPYVDYVHCNSVDLTPDSAIVISSRHMNEVTKIDRETGDIVWRMGLNAVNNQFSFPNDTRGFSHQHDARVLPNGHLTLFDNGNFLVPAYSRALEFEIDDTNHVATVVWEYRHVPDVVSGFMGNVQRHADGSTTIGWGGNFSGPKATDVAADGSVTAEITMSNEQVNYRTFRFPWTTPWIEPDSSALTLVAATIGQSATQGFTVVNREDRPFTITCLRSTHPQFVAALVDSTLPLTLAPGESCAVTVTFTADSPDTLAARLYVQMVTDLELVARSVNLTGYPADVAAVGPDGGPVLALSAAPNPVRGDAAIHYALPGPGPARLEVFDVRGARVAVLEDGPQAAGAHAVTWRTAGRAAGLYWVRLRTPGAERVRAVVVTH